jgi:hypothetical protein
VGEQPGVPFYRPGSRDVPLACLLASNGIAVIGCLAVRRVASRCLACKWIVSNLAWWSVPNLHACMSYLYVCMCWCTTDTCLLVLCMLVVHACCRCVLLVCVINGKSEYCLGGCFVLLHLPRIYECDVAIHGEER